jgi:SAM-dependent methyltransferase
MTICAASPEGQKIMVKGSVLYPGCGNERVPDWMDVTQETRLDIDESCHPDIVASITDMGNIGTFDNVYTCHTLEHLFEYDVQKALLEFKRVLNPDGTVLIFVPDLEGVTCNDEVLYESPGGPICGRDLYYGLTKYVEISPYYAHHTGFVKESLEKHMIDAGFKDVSVTRISPHNLMGVGKKEK